MMTEESPEAIANRNVDGDVKNNETAKKKRGCGSKTSKSLSNLAKEAEAILKGFNEKEEVPEGRRATRSSTRNSALTPFSTPPPIKREKKSASPVTNRSGSAVRGTKRGRPKKSTTQHAKIDDGSCISNDNNCSESNEKLTTDNGNDKIETSKNNDQDDAETKSSEDRTCADSVPLSLNDYENTKKLESTEKIDAANKSLTTNGSIPQESLSVSNPEDENVKKKCESKIPSSNSEKIEEINDNPVISDDLSESVQSTKSSECEKSHTNFILDADAASSSTITSND